MNSLEKLVDYFNGNLSELTRTLNIKRTLINYWRDKVGYIPEEYALRVERITGGQIAAQEVLYDAEQHKGKVKARQ